LDRTVPARGNWTWIAETQLTKKNAILTINERAKARWKLQHGCGKKGSRENVPGVTRENRNRTVRPRRQRTKSELKKVRKWTPAPRLKVRIPLR